MRVFIFAFFCLSSIILSSCGHLPKLINGKHSGIPSLDSQVLSKYRSGSQLSVARGSVLTDNEDAFETKLDLIKQARENIDLAYYIFSDDHTSSLFARELLTATSRGVRVRMLLDYHSHYQNLDYFNMLEEFGNRGPGSLTVRLYNRPTRHIVKDAVFMTLGCGPETPNNKADCSQRKFDEIENLFAGETIDGIPVASKNVSNINTGNSGLFLSGLYAKNPELMAMAVANGQDIDVNSFKNGAQGSNPDDTAKLKELARLYWLANYGSGLDRWVNRIKLTTAFLFYGEQIDPVYDAFTAFLPVERTTTMSGQELQRARSDWQFLSDFLHHKILLVDQRDLIIGGRNVEDSYHTNPGPLSAKYTFMDTDVHLEFTAPDAGIVDSFEKLWQFSSMVATLKDVEQHAPNDFLVSSKAAKAACESLSAGNKQTHQACLDNALLDLGQILPANRHKSLFDQMNRRADRYLSHYVSTDDVNRSPIFTLDANAATGYVENLPFDKDLSSSDTVRFYGATNDQEHSNGKNIHALWLSALKNTCERATPESPSSIYWHNAYFFLPSNLLSAIAQMLDGRQPCANVDIVVLTNSIETTDLNIVNILSRHSVKALFEHYADHHDKDNGATLSYFEYVPLDNDINRSLHSKVMTFGDDIFIGSANADLRSYMMDSNNGLFIRQAPRLLAEYTSWLRSILGDSSLTKRKNDDYLNTSQLKMLEAGDQVVDSEISKYRAERFLKDPAQVDELKARLRDASNEVYRLSRKIIADHEDSKNEQALFNRLFKAI